MINGILSGEEAGRKGVSLSRASKDVARLVQRKELARMSS